MGNNDVMDLFMKICETFEANKHDEDYVENLQDEGNWVLTDEATKALFGDQMDDGNLALGVLLGRFRRKSGSYFHDLNKSLNAVKVAKYGHGYNPKNTISVKSTLCYIVNNMDLSMYNGIIVLE